jgi:ATP-dependent RNA helicase DHX8/PRP22
MQRDTFSQDIDTLKSIALEEFIRDHVLYQQKSTKSIPTKVSVTTLNQHIDKLKKLLSTKPSYKGCELQHFEMIVQILQRIMIYYNCFLLQLPLFNVSMDLLNKIENNTVTTIETATGSGKSTLLPALLVAEGYDKIIVTQPRRLPCNLISQRVNSMVSDDISGWAVSGAEHNIQAKILYMTDGFLKERLLNDQNLITRNTKLNKSVVFFIDEVHERSVNIDLCLALFARLLKLNPNLKTKMKLIISSATLDASVPALFKKNSDCSLNEFNLTSISKLYEVDVKQKSGENILDLVQQLYSKRVRNEQILCFVGSTQEVYENCALLKTLTKGAIVAYPLVQSQSAKDQQQYIEQGTVFFSTTVAETSLTFPCLKYVIDTGIINMPVYNIELERSELKETKTAESNTKQRLGRLGRTQPGEYYALYNYKPGS